ncbi:MAG: alpha/beta fold hydrolase [Flavobacteriaceae bacterium]|nr:alpha/beta fold hydrolase [Flavobacteriaceae bacterium]
MSILHSQIIGKGSENLLVLHGLFGSGNNWKSLAKKLSNFLTLKVHLIDLRNHGKSFWSDDMDFDLMSTDIFRYLHDKDIDKCSILGHSLGGRLAMKFSASYPDLVDRLIVVDIGPSQYTSRHNQLFQGLNRVLKTPPKSRVQANELLKKFIPLESVRQFLIRDLYYNQSKELVFSMNVKSLWKNQQILTKRLEMPVANELETYFIWGGDSDYYSPLDIELIREYFPSAKMITINKAGHWVHRDNPKLFSSVVLQIFEI